MFCHPAVVQAAKEHYLSLPAHRCRVSGVWPPTTTTTTTTTRHCLLLLLLLLLLQHSPSVTSCVPEEEAEPVGTCIGSHEATWMRVRQLCSVHSVRIMVCAEGGNACFPRSTSTRHNVTVRRSEQQGGDFEVCVFVNSTDFAC